jgi:kumamolisin
MPEKLIPLKGSVPPNKHPRVGPADPQEQIEVTLKLRRKSEDGLPTLKEFTAGKRVAITRQQLEERYGALPEDAAQVQRWAVSSGLSVWRVDLGRRQLHLSGSIAAVSRAFGVKLAIYRHTGTGTLFRCPTTGAIRIPKSLASIIVGVFGLNDMPALVRHSVRPLTRPTDSDPETLFPGSFYPPAVAKLYNFPPTQGDGQRVAILEFGGGYDPKVLSDYFTGTLGLKTAPTVNAIFVLGAKMDIPGGATGEVYLDLEVVGGMAPQATIDVYFAPFTGEGYLNAIDQAIHNDDYAAVSISYGLDEDLNGTAANPGWTLLNQNIDEAFRDATAVGIPVFVSSGDQGSGSMRGQVGQNEVTVLAPTAHVSYPASSPYAISVGGTMLYAASGAISQEVVWNELGTLQQGKFYYGGAGGGGVSDRYTDIPSYQSGAGISIKSANKSAPTGRVVPDVAGNSGASTGYLVTQPPGSQYPIAPVGGTSAAAPMWAALMACVREALASANGGNVPVFFFNDFAYANGTSAAFSNVVGGREFSFDPQSGLVPGKFIPIGNNRSTKVNGYSASKGFNACTGWGSPNGAALLKQLQTWLAGQSKS